MVLSCYHVPCYNRLQRISAIDNGIRVFLFIIYVSRRCARSNLVPARTELNISLSMVKNLTETLKMPCTIELENEFVNIIQWWISENKIANTVYFWNSWNISAVKIRAVTVVKKILHINFETTELSDPSTKMFHINVLHIASKAQWRW